MIETSVDETFKEFVMSVEPGLRRALGGHLPLDRVPDALAEAFAYAWQNWERVQQLDNPAGYLFRVAQSKSRSRRSGVPPAPESGQLPHVEPRLPEAMRSLSPRQRSVVWLVHGCGWTYAETAVALAISPASVGTHLGRGMSRLRAFLGVDDDK